MDPQPEEITEVRVAPGTDKTEFANQDTVGVYFPPNDPENPQEGWSTFKRWRGASRSLPHVSKLKLTPPLRVPPVLFVALFVTYTSACEDAFFIAALWSNY